MGIKRGTAAYGENRKRVEKEQKQRKAGGGKIWDLRLKDGESALCRFVGLFRPAIDDDTLDEMSREDLSELGELYAAIRRVNDETGKKEKLLEAVKRRMRQEEPIMVESHWLNRLRITITCDHDNTFGTGGCAVCEYRESNKTQRKDLGFPKSESCFFVIDHRRQHRIKKGDDDVEYVDCTMESKGSCKRCKRADEEGPVYPSRMNGLRVFKNGQKRAAEILARNEQAKQHCLHCNAKLKTEGYECGNCGAELGDLEAEGLRVKCRKCGKRAIPIERVVPRKECNREDCVPTRARLSDFLVTISRTGEEKQTVYSFTLEDLEPMSDEEIEQMSRYPEDITQSESFKPPPQAETAAKLGNKDSRFLKDQKQSAGASSYDDDDFDDDDEDDDEPKKDKSKKKGKTKKRSRDEDDDDDSDDDDD